MGVDGERGGVPRRRRANVLGGRRHAHRVRVTPEEEAALLARAGRLGFTVPRLMIEAALAEGDGSLESVQREEGLRREVLSELFRARRTLGVSASNLNQIARVANATGEVDPSVPHAVAHLRRVSDRLLELMEGWGVRR